MIVMTGLHGNEPAGVHAAERVIARLDGNGAELKGTLVAFAGNLKALAEKTRFLDRDLNRQWTSERMAAIAAGTIQDAEVEEQRELLDCIREVVQAKQGPLYFLDLHTMSATGAPFVTVGDTMRNRGFARSFPLPLILGLEEQVDGALLEYLNNLGLVTMGAEAGQHDCGESVDRFEALLWLALRRVGLVPSDPADDRAHTELLRLATRGVPPVVEVRYRHPIRDEDQFKMVPGYDNFVHVKKGEVVAHDRNGPVQAPQSGLMLLPLYQGKGEDGFFIALPVAVFWLRLSTFLRRRRLGAFLRWLPGVRRRGNGDMQLEVNTRIARWYPLEIFHLFGFRKRRKTGDTLIVSRRAFDFEGPDEIRL